MELKKVGAGDEWNCEGEEKHFKIYYFTKFLFLYECYTFIYLLHLLRIGNASIGLFENRENVYHRNEPQQKATNSCHEIFYKFIVYLNKRI